MSAPLVFGLIFLVISAVIFFVRKNQMHRLRSFRLAEKATVAELQQLAGAVAQEIGGGSWEEYVKLTGMIHCDQPLLSELREEPCVYYRMTVTREYEETVTKTDEEGKSYRETQRRSEVVSDNQRSIPFYLEDATGMIEVNPEGADLETISILDDFRTELDSGGMISYGNFSLALGDGGGGRRTLGYRYSESIVPIDRRALIVGIADDRNGHICLQQQVGVNRPFIVSLKDEETLTKTTSKNIQLAFYGMVASGGLGLCLIIIGLLT